MENLGTLCYDQYVTEKDMGDLSIKHFKSDKDEQNYKRIKGNRKKVIAIIQKMDFTASFADIKQIGKIEPSKARYAYGRVTDAIKESFKDDTYWGA